MKFKKFIAVLCVMACVMSCFAACGKAQEPPVTKPVEENVTELATEPVATVPETEAPQISEETLLIMELMENYLNREQPRHETAQYRFGLRTTTNKVPVYQYDDYSYTPNGEAEYWNSNNAYTMTYGNVYTINREKEQKWIDLAVNGYEYPEVVQRHWAHKNYCQYYFTDTNGSHREANPPLSRLGYRMEKMNIPYMFSCLDQNSFEDYMTEKISTHENAEAFFSLGEEELHNMDELQEWILNEQGKAMNNPENIGNGPSGVSKQTVWVMNGLNGLSEKPAKHNYYTVKYDISSEYQNENSASMIWELFQNLLVAGIPQNGNYGDYSYAETRLDDGMLHVTLYFDKNTKQCVAEKIDATDCAGPMIDYLIGRGNVEKTDGTFIIERQYSDKTDFEKLPEKMIVGYKPTTVNNILQDQNAFKNKIVTGSTEFDVAKVEKYTLDYDQKAGIYKIMDGNKTVAVSTKYLSMNPSEAEFLNTAVNTEMVGDYGIRFFELPMSNVFESNNKNNEDIGYAAIALYRNSAYDGIGIYAWDQEVLKDILANMTFIRTNDPAAA